MIKDNPKAAFDKWWEDKRAFAFDDNTRDLTWEYFHREFPRATAEMEIANQTSITIGQIPIVLRIFERLWNGGEQEGVCTMGCADTVCPTCGGSGEACGLHLGCCTRPAQKMHGCKYCQEWGACPDCTEKDPIYRRKVGDEHYPIPNERKGQQRVHIRRCNDTVYGYREAEAFQTTLGRRKGDRRD